MKPNSILKRALIFIGVYIIMLLLSEVGGLKKGLQKHVKAVTNTALSSFGNGGKVEFTDIVKKVDKEKYKAYDILVTMTSTQQIEKAREKARLEGKTKTSIYPTSFGMDSWVHLGLLLSFFIALIFALPSSLKNKLILFVIGFVVLDLFLIFKMWVSLNLKYSVRYEKFGVGWTNTTMVEGLNHIHNIVAFPFFGFMMLVILSLLFFDKKSLSDASPMPVLPVF